MITGWYVLNKHLVLNKHPSSSLSRTDLIITLASTGTLHENTTWPENAENVQIFTCRLPIIVLHIFMKHKYFFLWFLSLEHSHFWLTHSLMRNTKRLACDVQHTCWSHWQCHRHRLPVTKWQCPGPCFCNSQTLILNKPDYTFFYSNPVNTNSSLRVPFSEYISCKHLAQERAHWQCTDNWSVAYDSWITCAQINSSMDASPSSSFCH